MGREREKKKILVPNSVHTRPGQENSKKNRKKKHQKTKKPSFQYYFLPKRDEIGRKREKKNFSPEFRSNSARKKIVKKIGKKFQKLKNLFPALFLSKMGRYRPRKRKINFTPEFFSNPTRARKFQKKSQKNSKK